MCDFKNAFRSFLISFIVIVSCFSTVKSFLTRFQLNNNRFVCNYDKDLIKERNTINTINIMNICNKVSFKNYMVSEAPPEILKKSRDFDDNNSLRWKNIRWAKHNDLQAVVNLRVEVFYPELRQISSFNHKILDKLKQRRERGAECLVAENNGDIVGTIEFSPSDFEGTSMEHVGYDRKLYLMDLAVRPDVRRQGIATALLKEVETYAIENDYRDIYLHVEVGNESARNLYIRNGFIEVLPLTWAIQFTEKRLHKSWVQYILLYKAIF